MICKTVIRLAADSSRVALGTPRRLGKIGVNIEWWHVSGRDRRVADLARRIRERYPLSGNRPAEPARTHPVCSAAPACKLTSMTESLFAKVIERKKAVAVGSVSGG